MNCDEIATAVSGHQLMVMGAFQQDSTSTILIGAASDLWPHFITEPEYRDGSPDALDRWSKRVIGTIAARAGGAAQYPSDGPPYPPFIAWALKTGRFWQSPVGMLVHDEAGLMISLRGAIILPRVIPIPQVTAHTPCLDCSRPCVTACPVGALSAEAPYDVAACKDHLAQPKGSACMDGGCLARCVCPVSALFNRDRRQSAFHMRHFLG